MSDKGVKSYDPPCEPENQSGIPAEAFKTQPTTIEIYDRFKRRCGALTIYHDAIPANPESTDFSPPLQPCLYDTFSLLVGYPVENISCRLANGAGLIVAICTPRTKEVVD